MGKIDQRLQELGITLPEPANPVATYVRYVQTGNLLFISGSGPSADQPSGKCGADLSIEVGYQVARNVGIGIIATAKQARNRSDPGNRINDKPRITLKGPGYHHDNRQARPGYA
jgi:hypothetical protein